MAQARRAACPAPLRSSDSERVAILLRAHTHKCKSYPAPHHCDVSLEFVILYNPCKYMDPDLEGEKWSFRRIPH